MLTQGFPKSNIGEFLGKDKSVIGREIERNKDQRNGKYSYVIADKNANYAIKKSINIGC
jgi:IS30 family transposase